MKPLISGPPFERALAELAAAAKHGSSKAGKLTPHDARRELLAGRCGMALCWPTGSRSEARQTETPASVAAGFAELPGAAEVYDVRAGKWTRRAKDDEGRVPLLSCAGRLGSVAKESRRQRQAFNVLVWLSGKDHSSEIDSQSPDTTLFRRSHLVSPELWTDPGLDPQAVGQYAKLIEESNQRSAWLFSLRIPGRARYLEALDEAVGECMSGQKSAEEALSSASEKWQAITTELGVEKQRRAYLRSLGLEP
jgi:ABC-type glycerol-3-phosphate transport system substrate-binding protein